MRRVAIVVALACAAFACDVEPVAPSACGGDASCASFAGATGARGLVALDSDYASTNVVLVGPSGGVLASLVSSSSARPGLSAALSGDVILPSTPPASGAIVLLDRTNGVVTWIEPASCGVRAQLSLGSFGPNPWDYVEAGGKAYVTRYATNATPTSSLDAGGDVAIVDPATPALVGTIDLRAVLPSSSPAAALPYPGRLARFRDRVLVLLQGWGPGYETAADATIAAIDPSTDAIAWSVTIPGVNDCSEMVVGPDDRVAIGCWGPFFLHGSGDPLDASAIVVLAPGDDGRLVEATRLAAHDAVGRPFAGALDWIDATRLFASAFGDKDTGAPDELLVVDLSAPRPVATRVGTAHGAFSSGGVVCGAGSCVASDAGGPLGPAGLRTFAIVASGVAEADPTPFCDPYGLPPRGLVRF